MSLTYSCNYGATSSCGNPMNWCDCAGHGERPSRLARSKLDTLKGRPTRDHGLSKIGKISVFFSAKFAIFWRARSRLYQNEILQENMRLTAFFKLYKICVLLHQQVVYHLLLRVSAYALHVFTRFRCVGCSRLFPTLDSNFCTN